MANKKKTDDKKNKPTELEAEEFDDSVENQEDIEFSSDNEENSDQQLAEILSDPAKAVKIVEEEPEENEEVLYCPNCGITGLFVDNICTNCGKKKTKKSNSADEELEEDSYINEDIIIDEYS